MDLLINTKDRNRTGVLALVNGQVMASTAKLPRLIRNDGEPIAVRCFEPSESGAREFDEEDISADILRVGIGLPDLAPTAGTFTVTETTGPATSAALAFDVTAAAMSTALNLLPVIITAGGVTVAKPASGAYQITFNNPGVQTARFGTNTAKLAPLSVGKASRVQIGNSDVQEIVLLQLVQNAHAYNVLADPLPSPGATIEHVQEGTSELPDVQRILLSPRPYAGTFEMTIAGETLVAIPFNVGRAQLQSMVGPKYEVEQIGNSEWVIQTVDPGAIAAITIDATDLVVATGVKGTLALNTMSIYSAFLATTRTVLTFILEVQRTRPGEAARTIFQAEIEMVRNVIDLATLASASTLGLQTTYTSLYGDVGFTWSTSITGMTGGAGTLEAVTTAEKAIGYRYEYFQNGVINAFVLMTGAADVDDPTGQVAPLDYNAGSNNKHWERAA